MSPLVRLAFLAVAWILWLLPFFIRQSKGTQKAVQVATGARWGIVLVSIGFMAVFMHRPEAWAAEFSPVRLCVGAVFAFCGILLSWTAVAGLGRQWRVDAGLNADHELVRSGPYRIVRHPIYASMLCMLLTWIAAIGTLPGWPIAIVLFIVGTEIRVWVEDRLLRSRFHEQFDQWQKSVPAYLPFIR